MSWKKTEHFKQTEFGPMKTGETIEYSTSDTLKGELERARAEIESYRAALVKIQKHVDQQAEDEGVWSVPFEGLQPIGEAYLQQELRALHRTIEEAHKALEGK